jgi:hypothetical protein
MTGSFFKAVRLIARFAGFTVFAAAFAGAAFFAARFVALVCFCAVARGRPTLFFVAIIHSSEKSDT